MHSERQIQLIPAAQDGIVLVISGLMVLMFLLVVVKYLILVAMVLYGLVGGNIGRGVVVVDAGL